jgi:hypothetical protein
MIATYRGNTYETNSKPAEERNHIVLTYRGVKYRSEWVNCRARLVRSAD